MIIFRVSHGTPFQLYHGPLGGFVIDGIGEPHKEHARFTSIPIPEKLLQPIDQGFNQRMNVSCDIRSFARDIVEPFSELGVHVAAGDVPTEAELIEAERRYKLFLMQKLDEGKKVWERSRRAIAIEESSRIAAKVFGYKADWVSSEDTAGTLKCPSCRNDMVFGATKCPTCHDRFSYVDGKPVLFAAVTPAVDAGVNVPAPSGGKR